MSDLGSSRPVLRFFAAFAGLVVLAWLVFLTGFWQAMAPDPQTVDPTTRRAAPVRTLSPSTADADEAPDPEGPFAVSGRVLGSEGGPQADTPLIWRAHDGPADPVELGRTGPDGSFAITVPAPGMLQPRLWTQPERVHVSADRSELEFVGIARCPVSVDVQAPDGSPVFRQTVRARIKLPHRSSSLQIEQSTGEDGTAQFDDMPCGVASIWVRRAGYPQGRRDNVDTVVDQHLIIQLADGVSVTGRVTDLEGEPIEDARVHSGNASDYTDADGLYGLMVDARNLSRVNVSADGFASTSERLRIATADADATELVLDFVLERARLVTVYCAGLPDDSCASIVPMFCTRTFLPVGEMCKGDPTVCRCPEGSGAIRGGGMAVEVEPDDTEVWLDLSGRGGIRGRVLIGGKAVDPSVGRCNVLATRLPTALEDIPGGMSAGGQGSCLPDGHFEITGLKSGRYMVMAHTTAGEGNDPSVKVNGEMVDVGTIDIGGGGRIEGVVIDGVTGDGVPGQAVVAYQGSNDELAGLGQTVSGAEGRFTISGLVDGDYEVILANRPFTTESVTITDGRTDDVELTTGEAGLLTSNGFELETDDAGNLVVGTVDPDGAAAGAGLEEGDVVVGVTLGGMDVGELVPGMSDEITDAVLDHWGGPGVGLVVDRDGDRTVVGLD